MEKELFGNAEYLQRTDYTLQEATEDNSKAETEEEESEIDSEDEDVEEEEENWENTSKEELFQKAKDMGLDVNPNMSKEELIKVIREAGSSI